MPENETKPCPFCGWQNPISTKKTILWQVECGECLARGPFGDDAAAALSAWNARVPAQSAGGGVETGSMPNAAPGHWSTRAGRDMAADYAAKTRDELCSWHLNDFELANAQYLVDRDSLDLIAMQTATKERIRWLSVQLFLARAVLTDTAREGVVDLDVILERVNQTFKHAQEHYKGNVIGKIQREIREILKYEFAKAAPAAPSNVGTGEGA